MKRQPHYAEIADAISWNMERKRRMQKTEWRMVKDLRCGDTLIWENGECMKVGAVAPSSYLMVKSPGDLTERAINIFRDGDDELFTLHPMQQVRVVVPVKAPDMQLPTTIFFALTLNNNGDTRLLGDFHYDGGPGNRGYAFTAEDRAYNEWVEAIDKYDIRGRAFRIDFDVATNAPEIIREVTDDFVAQREQIMLERDLTKESDE